MSDLVNSLRLCAAGDCDERCHKYYYGAGCRGVLMDEAAAALQEWEKYTSYLAAHNMFPTVVESRIEL